MLLEAGANLSVRNNEGKTPIAVSRNQATRAAISQEVAHRNTANTAVRTPGSARNHRQRCRPNSNNVDGGAGTSGSGTHGDLDRVSPTVRAAAIAAASAATSPMPSAVTPVRTRTTRTPTNCFGGSPEGRSSRSGRRGSTKKSKESPASMICHSTPLSPSANWASTYPASPGMLRIKSKLRDDLKCAVCLRDFCSEGDGSAPVTLPCGHNFCDDCVEHMRGKGETTRAFKCPLDRTMFSRNMELRVNGTMRDLITFMGARIRSGSGGSNSIGYKTPVPMSRFASGVENQGSPEQRARGNDRSGDGMRTAARGSGQKGRRGRRGRGSGGETGGSPSSGAAESLASQPNTGRAAALLADMR